MRKSQLKSKQYLIDENKGFAIYKGKPYHIIGYDLEEGLVQIVNENEGPLTKRCESIKKIVSVFDIEHPRVLEFEVVDRRFGKDDITVLRALVPGVNSGAYSKELHITMSDKDKNFVRITLDEHDVRELRDECSKILNLVI
jgi:hypothetical protein